MVTPTPWEMLRVGNYVSDFDSVSIQKLTFRKYVRGTGAPRAQNANDESRRDLFNAARIGGEQASELRTAAAQGRGQAGYELTRFFRTAVLDVCPGEAATRPCSGLFCHPNRPTCSVSRAATCPARGNSREF